MDPWCHPAITASHAFAMLELMIGVAAVVHWYLLSHGQEDIPPKRHFKVAPPDAENPEGKFRTINAYTGGALCFVQGCFGLISVTCWDQLMSNGYASLDGAIETRRGISWGMALGEMIISLLYFIKFNFNIVVGWIILISVVLNSVYPSTVSFSGQVPRFWRS